MRTEGVTSMELSNLSSSPGAYENRGGYINGTIPIPSYYVSSLMNLFF